MAFRRAEGFAPRPIRPCAALTPLWLLFLCASLTACGGGSDSGGGGERPVASFTATPSSGEAPLIVDFNASASTDDGTITAYAWAFGDAGSGSGVTTTHTFTTAGTYTVTLTVTDDDGSTGQTTRTVTVSGPPPTSVTVSGRITFERVPFSFDINEGLDYSATAPEPARAIVVELIASSNQAVLATTVTDESGLYAFTTQSNTNVFVRARAQTRRVAPSWDIRVLNNTNGNALYVLDSSTFNTGTANVTRDLLADSGWPDFGGTNYSGTRAAAPFAIVDTLYSAVQFVLDNGDSTVDLPSLDVFWSPNNRLSDTWDPPNGNILSTLYQDTAVSGAPPGIYVLGLASNDTDEFDQHVLAHEFQHYLEDAISRSETPGGPHSINERLDMRLAFSEGFANAFSAMVLDDPVYSDSFGTSQRSRFWIDVEDNGYAPEGWYNEGSVHSIVWDLYDAAADNPDTVSIGYGPMYEVLTGPVRTGQALVSIYPFISALKARAGAPVAAIDTLVQAQSVFGTDAFGAAESNSGGVLQALPIYTNVALNGGAQRVCGSTVAGVYNAIGNRRFLKFSLAGTTNVTIRAAYTSTGSAIGGPTPDPDIVLYRSGFLAIAETETANEEVLTQSLAAGDYVIEVYEFSHIDLAANPSRRGVTCMNVSVTS